MENHNSVHGAVPRVRGGAAATRILIMLVAGTCFGLGIYFWPHVVAKYYQPKTAMPRLTTGGTGAILVVAENFWKGKYAKEKGVEIVCESVGSTQGVTRLLDDTYSIAFTHAPAAAELRDKAKKNGCELVEIPLMLCGVVPAYHLTGLDGKKPLNFTGEVLAGIYLGKITRWDDPALKAINPDVKLPAKKIAVIHREDSSGTTQIFTRYLAAVSPDWKQQVGVAADKVKWPTGTGAERNQGVAEAIRTTDGSIGYIDRMYAILPDLMLDYGAVQNHDKTAFIHEEPANTTAVVGAILKDIPDDLTFDLTDKPGKDSYPIAGVIYAVCADVQLAAKRQQVVDFLHWAVHEGQQNIEQTSFAPLPAELIPRIDKRLEAIKAK